MESTKQRDLYEPPHVRNSETSREAADSIAPQSGALRKRVLDFIKAHVDGATCDEVEAALEMRHQTASARIRELAKARAIMDSGNTRRTRSGRQAVVWR